MTPYMALRCHNGAPVTTLLFTTPKGAELTIVRVMFL
jgi:hypothetical protein